MNDEKIFKLVTASITLFIAGIVTSYLGLIDVSHGVELNLYQEATFVNTFILMGQMLAHSVWFSVMLLCFIASAVVRPACFSAGVLASMFLFIGWLCAIHSGLVFLPCMSEVYSTGWSHITISQHFTLTSGVIAVIMFLIGLVAHYRMFYRDDTWDDYTFETLLP